MGLKFIEAHKFDIDDFLDNSYFEKYLDTSSESVSYTHLTLPTNREV